MKKLIIISLFLLGSCQKENKVVAQNQLVEEEDSIVLNRDRIDSQIGRAHVRTPVTEKSRMPSSA